MRQGFPGNDLHLGLCLLLGLRLTLLLTHSPVGFIVNYTDVVFYYDLARWLDVGKVPYFDYWVEYPPIIPFLSVGVYWISQQLANGFESYQVSLALAFLPFDLGTFALLYRLGRRLGGEDAGRRAAWSWALLGFPLYVWWYSFDGVGVFFLLLGVELALTRRWIWVGAVLAIGILVKIFPGLGILALWQRGQQSYRMVLGVVLATAAILVPLLLSGPRYLWPSIANLFARSSWDTVWSILDGFFGTGTFLGPLEIRWDPDSAQMPLHPTIVPGYIPFAALVVALLLAWLAVPRTLPKPLDLIGRTGLMTVVFFLVNKGWSPQFIVWILPFCLLLMPPRRSIFYALALTAANLLEWPLGFAANNNYLTWISGPAVLVVSIIARTALLLMLSVDIAISLRKAAKLRPGIPMVEKRGLLGDT